MKNIRWPVSLLLIALPSICHASDMMGVAFVFTLPLLAISLAVAFTIAYAGKGVWSYLTLILLILINAVPGTALTRELAGHGHDLVAATLHAGAYLALIAPLYILHQRIKPPPRPERKW